jgi:hypothetical protein
VLPLQAAMDKNNEAIGGKKTNFILIPFDDLSMLLYRLYTASIMRLHAATRCQSKRTHADRRAGLSAKTLWASLLFLEDISRGSFKDKST